MVDGSKPMECSISEVSLSTKSARSQEKFTENVTITGLVANPLAHVE